MNYFASLRIIIDITLQIKFEYTVFARIRKTKNRVTLLRKKIIYWNEDSFLTTNGTFLKYDKLEHLILAFIGVSFSRFFVENGTAQSFLLVLIFWNVIGIGWELFQLFVRKQAIEIKDIAANNIGFLLGIAFYL